MIKEKDLVEMASWNYKPDPDFDLEAISQALNNNIEEYNYLAKVEYEKISGGSFLNPKEYDCIKVYNPEHPSDYFYFCICLSKERRSDVVRVFAAGKSTQMKMDDYLKNTKVFDGTISGSLKLGTLRGGSVGAGMAIGGVVSGLTKAGIRGIGKGIAALTRDKEAFAVEESWYAEAQELIGGTFNPAE